MNKDTDLNIEEIERLAEKNLAMKGTIISSAREPKEAKDISEVCMDMAIFLLVKFCDDEISGDSSNSEYVGHMVNYFAKHLRMHAQQDSKQKAK